MDYLADGLGILGFALLLAKFIVARHERQRIYGKSSWTTSGTLVSRVPVFGVQPLGYGLRRRQPYVELQTPLAALLVFPQESGKKPARFTSLSSQTLSKKSFSIRHDGCP